MNDERDNRADDERQVLLEGAAGDEVVETDRQRRIRLSEQQYVEGIRELEMEELMEEEEGEVEEDAVSDSVASERIDEDDGVRGGEAGGPNDGGGPGGASVSDGTAGAAALAGTPHGIVGGMAGGHEGVAEAAGGLRRGREARGGPWPVAVRVPPGYAAATAAYVVAAEGGTAPVGDNESAGDRAALPGVTPPAVTRAAREAAGDADLPGGAHRQGGSSRREGDAWGGACIAWGVDERAWMKRAQLSAWPHWVYRMYDAFDLARRVADMFHQIAPGGVSPELVANPESLSFYVAGNLPVQDRCRQELLELPDTVQRLRREGQLLESLDKLTCHSCKAVLARRSDMIMMSTDGPMGTYVNPTGYVHEILTLRRAKGLVLDGLPQTYDSWFPG
eukprot:jgi/Mesen1/2809/ME000172S01962